MANTIPSLNGIPQLGFGTYPLTGADAVAAVTMALELGYRHIDTAQMYANEADVGRAIGHSDVPRDEIYVVSKVLPANFAPDRFLPSVRRSLDDLGIDQLDLLLLHWPPLDQPLPPVIEWLGEAQSDGLTAAIGVSNFTPAMLRVASEVAAAPLITNQIEFHPLLDQSAPLAAGRDLGIVTSAFCPLARGAVFGKPAIQQAAARHHRSEAQVVLRWILQQGVVAVPMSTKPANARANLEALDFVLGDDEMAAISALTSHNHRIVSPPEFAPDWDA